jgi:hypothetical protein
VKLDIHLYFCRCIAIVIVHLPIRQSLTSAMILFDDLFKIEIMLWYNLKADVQLINNLTSFLSVANGI